MKKLLYVFLCMVTCIAFLTACGKEKSATGQVGSDSSQETENTSFQSEDAEEETSTAVPEDEVINPDAEDEPGDENLTSDDDGNVTIQDGSEEESEEPDDSTTDVQDKVSKNPSEEFNGSGTFNGFVDSSSVEITMSDGSYQTFFVYDEDVLASLQKLEEAGNSPTIQFTYGGIEGQVNPEIISVQ